jgi:cation-transporting P-type ATPase I
MLYQGTTVAAGEAVAVVVATGTDTEARRALAWSAGEASPPTGVEARLEQLTKLTIPLALLSGAGVSIAGMLRHTPTTELVDASLGLAVAAVPEGLPLLANAAQRAAARRLSRTGCSSATHARSRRSAGSTCCAPTRPGPSRRGGCS